MGRYFKINAKFVDITNKACIIFLPDGRQDVFPKKFVKDLGSAGIAVADWLLRKKFGIRDGEEVYVSEREEITREHIVPATRTPVECNDIDELAR